jgi:hypothetical protein
MRFRTSTLFVRRVRVEPLAAGHRRLDVTHLAHPLALRIHEHALASWERTFVSRVHVQDPQRGEGWGQALDELKHRRAILA